MTALFCSSAWDDGVYEVNKYTLMVEYNKLLLPYHRHINLKMEAHPGFYPGQIYLFSYQEVVHNP